MSLRVLTVILLLGSLAACTEPEPSADPAERGYECVSLCYPGVPCHNICKLVLDEPGFQIVPAARSCDDLRPINVCGDGCCDVAESNFRDKYCRADCRIEKLEVIDLEGLARPVIRDGEEQLGWIEERFVSVAPVCRWMSFT